MLLAWAKRVIAAVRGLQCRDVIQWLGWAIAGIIAVVYVLRPRRASNAATPCPPMIDAARHEGGAEAYEAEAAVSEQRAQVIQADIAAHGAPDTGPVLDDGDTDSEIIDLLNRRGL